MVIHNEKIFVEDNILADRMCPQNMRMRTLIRYLIRYYYPQFKNKTWQEYFEFIKQDMKEFNFKLYEYQEYLYADYMKKLCKKMLKGEIRELRQIDEVSITQAEMDIIRQCETERQQKVLFTLYVLAKVYGYDSGWVNFGIPEIFKLANVSMKYQDRLFMLHDIYEAGIIQINHTINKQGFKVQLVPDSPIAITVKKFENLGRQYTAAVKPDYVCCERCQKLFKIKNKYDHSTKYCSECAEIVNREKSKENMRQKRLKAKNSQTL